MRYGEALLDEVLRRTDIVQLVGRRVKLMRKGRVFWGLCPFHKEKSPSFKVDNERRNYKCFGCGAGGSAFKWLMEAEGLSFQESVERLAGEAGVELPKWTPADEERERRRKSLYDIIEAAAVFFERQLETRDGAAARAYLSSRGLDNGTVGRFRLGYAPQSGNALVRHLAAANVPLEDVVAAGLARDAEDGRPARDFFFHRVMFPISDGRGRTVAFGGRALEADAKPKYINTAETSLFSKGELLYNFAAARASALKSGTFVVAEGYMDVIALAGAGIESAVAPLGTALTEEQLALLWRFAPEPILAFDGDDAGQRAGRRAARLALPHVRPGHSLRFAFLPAGEDPDSLIRSQGAEAIKRVLGAAEPLAEVLWRTETEGRDFATPERRAGLEQALAEITSRIGDAKVAAYYRREFETRVFGLFRRPPDRKHSVPGFVSRTSSRSLRPADTGRPVTQAVRTSALARQPGVRQRKEMELLGLVLSAPEIAQRQGEILASLRFADPLLDRLRNELLNVAASGIRLETAVLEGHLDRAGLSDTVRRLRVLGPKGDVGAEAESAGMEEDLEARWLAAALQLREIAESDPERRRAMERFKADPSEEHWLDYQRLLALRAHSN